MLYLITYDLRVPGQDYPDLTKTLEKRQAVRIQRSVWLLGSRTALNVGELRASIQRDGGLDKNDRIFVTVVTTPAGWDNCMISDAAMKQLYEQYAS